MASQTLKTWLNKASGQLQTKGCDAGEAELLLGFILHRSKADILAHLEQELPAEQINLAETVLQRRIGGEPIAYITGEKHFYGRPFKVTPDVLIPRPDSELIIDEAKKFLADKNTANIVDIGTGSGCLIITLALETDKKFRYQASDISLNALAIARENADEYAVDVSWHISNLWQTIPTQKFDLIIANLPYLTAEQLEENSLQAEPTLALYGGQGGLHYYQQLLSQLPPYLTKDSIVVLEIDPSQEHQLDDDIKKNIPTATIEYIPDLSGQTRLIKITIVGQ